MKFKDKKYKEIYTNIIFKQYYQCAYVTKPTQESELSHLAINTQ
jgi:hypothetical protein